MYTNKAAVENYIKHSLTEDEEALLMLIIPAIEQYIDFKCSTTFKKVDPTTRYYDSEGDNFIDIDPAYEITGVSHVNSYGQVDYTYNPDFEFILGPYNTTVKTEIQRRAGHFHTGEGSIAVTARFSSWENGVPADIKLCATRLAAGLLDNTKRDSAGTPIQSESIEGHSITYINPRQITPDLDSYALGDSYVRSVLAQRSGVLMG